MPIWPEDTKPSGVGNPATSQVTSCSSLQLQELPVKASNTRSGFGVRGGKPICTAKSRVCRVCRAMAKTRHTFVNPMKRRNPDACDAKPTWPRMGTGIERGYTFNRSGPCWNTCNIWILTRLLPDTQLSHGYPQAAFKIRSQALVICPPHPHHPPPPQKTNKNNSERRLCSGPNNNSKRCDSNPFAQRPGNPPTSARLGRKEGPPQGEFNPQRGSRVWCSLLWKSEPKGNHMFCCVLKKLLQALKI